MRTVRMGLAALVLSWPGVAGANASLEVPANGSITITDQGTGPRATWTYDDNVTLTCRSTSTGPNGIAQIVTVECVPVQGAPPFTCPRMVVARTTATVVGALASCERTLDLGVGSSAAASANLGRLTTKLVCAAYMDTGVLVPPYTVTCADPGQPGVARPAP